MPRDTPHTLWDWLDEIRQSRSAGDPWYETASKAIIGTEDYNRIESGDYRPVAEQLGPLVFMGGRSGPETPRIPVLSRMEMELPPQTKTLLDAVRSYEPPVPPQKAPDAEELQTLFNRGLYPGQTKPLGQREMDFENWNYKDRPADQSNISEDVRIEDQLRNMGIKPTGDNLLDWATYKNELLKREEDYETPEVMKLWQRGLMPGQNVQPKWPLPEGMEFTGERPPSTNWHGATEESYPDLTLEEAGYTPQSHLSEGYNEMLDRYLGLKGLDLNTYGAPEIMYPAPPWAKHVPPKPPDVPYMSQGGVVTSLDDEFFGNQPIQLFPQNVPIPTDQVGFPPEEFPYFDYTQAKYAPEELDEYGQPKPDFNSQDFIGGGNYYYSPSPRPNVTNNYYPQQQRVEPVYRDTGLGRRLAASIGSMPPATSQTTSDQIKMLNQQAAIDAEQRRQDALERRSREMEDEYERIHRFGTPENRLFMSPVNRDYMRDFYPPPANPGF